MSKTPATPVPPILNAAPSPAARILARAPVEPAVADAPVAMSGDQRHIERMALSAVRLAALGPQLAALAVRMDEQANSQARQAETIAAATRELSERLGAVVGRLQTASGNVHAVMGDIARIADQTRILSINASIEAARAGEHGRAFSIVAREVQELADQTRGSTQLIEERVQAIQGSVGDVASSVAPVSDAPRDRVTVQSVNAQVQVMAGTAEKQRDGAKSLRTLGDQVNRLTEELLLSVGTFRLAVHRQAGREFRALLPELSSLMDQPGRCGQMLTHWLAAHPGFELLYVTDTAGRQITGNIGWKGGRIETDNSVCGKNWRDRPWFANALRRSDEVATSDIYRSAATGDYCFTVSAVVRNATGLPSGVIAADVNFQKLLAGEGKR